ncbi:MAG: hypothetical protein U9Q22_01890, partial [Candidatus Altiarchaeota archaeon]|nr:hypothetical protein [Candidatus Altiarchaeota archaeon]
GFAVVLFYQYLYMNLINPGDLALLLIIILGFIALFLFFPDIIKMRIGFGGVTLERGKIEMISKPAESKSEIILER